jgi:hypothetical protein
VVRLFDQGVGGAAELRATINKFSYEKLSEARFWMDGLTKIVEQ